MSDPTAYPMPPVPPPPPGGQYVAPGKSSLPVISLILGILSMVCGGFVLGIAAIITGIIGRKKAKQSGQGGGMSLAGIITGIVGTVESIVVILLLIGGGLTLFNTVTNQVEIAQQLKAATVATEAYGADHNSYEGLSTTGLGSYGYLPSGNVTVTASSQARGTAYCIEGYLTGKPDTVIHMPADSSGSVDIDINGTKYRYSTGGCPPAS